MFWFWFGFFAFVAALLALDLGVLNRKAKEPKLATAAYWTAGWMTLGLSFTGVVYLMYENAWMGATLVEPSNNPGTDGAIMYVSAYLLEYALSVDNIFVISLLFHSFRVPSKYQHTDPMLTLCDSGHAPSPFHGSVSPSENKRVEFGQL